jgi:hypothetical protein
MKGKRFILLAMMLALAPCLLAQIATNIVVTPRASFTVADRSYSQIITNSGGTIYSNAGDPVASAIVIFDVPMAATNREAVFQFNQTLVSFNRPWLEIFAFNAPAVAGTNVVTLPKAFVDSIATNDFAVRQEVDVTGWTKQLAGQRVGLQIRNAPSWSGRMNFSDLKLVLVDPQTRDATPNVVITVPPPRLLDTNSVPLEASISDVDGNLTGWQLLLDGKIVASEEFAPTPTATAIWAHAGITNLTRGSHLLYFKAFSGTNAAVSQINWVFVREPRDWEHRWLGSFGSSGSFYVVDAAGRAHVWGRNESAQLGLGFRSDYVKRPVTLLPPQGERFRQIVSNTNSARALTDQSREYLWGLTFYSSPLLSDPGPISRIAMTDTYDYALGLDGVFLKGQFASSRRYVDIRAGARISYPKDDVGRIGFVQIPTNALPIGDYAASYPLSYAIGSDSQLYSWQPTVQNLVNEIHIAGVDGWRRVVGSETLTLAIDNAGRVWQWGVGFSPYESNPSAHLVTFPKTITNWLDITVTSQIAMALSADGELYAWGRGVAGMWSDPNAWVTTKPELVTGLPDLLDPNADEVAVTFEPAALSSTNVAFVLAAPTNSTAKIEASTDLVNWTTYTNVTRQGGAATVSVSRNGAAQKFFRVSR